MPVPTAFSSFSLPEQQGAAIQYRPYVPAPHEGDGAAARAAAPSPPRWTRLSQLHTVAPEPARFGDSFELPLPPEVRVHLQAPYYPPEVNAAGVGSMEQWARATHEAQMQTRQQTQRKRSDALLVAGVSIFLLFMGAGTIACTYYILKCYGL